MNVVCWEMETESLTIARWALCHPILLFV